MIARALIVEPQALQKAASLLSSDTFTKQACPQILQRNDKQPGSNVMSVSSSHGNSCGALDSSGSTLCSL